jgi:hypothetical protein
MKKQIKTVLVMAMLGVGTVGAAASYTSADITLSNVQGMIKVGPKTGASQMLGAGTPTVKNGVAYFTASGSQDDLSMALSPALQKLPLRFHVRNDQGDNTLDLSALKLTGLDVVTGQGSLELRLPAAGLNATLTSEQGDINVLVPANVGVRVVLKKLDQGKVILSGKTVADPNGADENGKYTSGTYDSANFDSAQSKVTLTVSMDQATLNVRTVAAVAEKTPAVAPAATVPAATVKPATGTASTPKAAPAAMNAQQQNYAKLLKGQMLTFDTSVTSGGVKSGETTVAAGVKLTLPGVGAVNTDVTTKEVLHLCSDGAYIKSNSDNAVGIKSSARETGTWAIGKANSAGFALLLTNADTNEVKAKNVSFDGERTVVDKERWYRAKSSACK